MSFEVVHELNPLISRQEFNARFKAPDKCKNLVDYLKRPVRQVELMQSEKELTLTTKDLVKQLEADNIIYAEIRFAPLLHTQGGLSADQVVETVNQAITKATASSPVTINLILCTLRHFSEEQSLQTAELVKQFSNTHVVALDLAGDEAGYPIENHISAFQFALNNGLNRTAHTGEAAGPESVRETIDLLQPTRLGHGVRSLENPALIDLIEEKDLHFEVCPTSNIQTDVFKKYKNHNIDTLFNEGLSVGINTDGKSVSNVTLSQEYEKLSQTFGWDKEHFLKCNLNALEAAFLDEEKKAPLKEKLLKSYSV